MSLVKKIDNLFGFDDDFHDLFNFNNLFRFESGRSYMIPMDLVENENEYIIEAEVPGLKEDEIEIEATFDYLEIHAERRNVVDETKDEDGVKYLRKERTNSKFSRRINFRTPIKPKDAQVTLENGILKIILPKSEEGKTVKLIPKIN